jgi:hypothetical protein
MMNKYKIHLPELYPYQEEVKNHLARFKVLAVGRRAGKSFFARIDALDRAVNEGQTVWLIYPSYGTAIEHWNKLMVSLDDGNAPFVDKVRLAERMIVFKSGGSIYIKSGDKYNNLRGAGLDHVVMDEAAFIKEEVFTSVILPSLADKQGSALLISTPYGRNWFWKFYNLGQDKAYKDWMSWQLPSTVSPMITVEERDLQRRIIPRRQFLREWMADFGGTGGGAFIGFEDTQTVPPLPDDYEFSIGTCDVGIDWGRKDDYTVVSAFNRQTREQVFLDRFTDIGFETQAARICKHLKLIKPRMVSVEYNHIGMVMFELLRKKISKEVRPGNPGLLLKAVEMTNPEKNRLVDHYGALIEHKYVQHFTEDHEFGVVQGQEVSGYTVEHTDSGLKLKFGNSPEAGHDDIVVANMLAVRKIPIPLIGIEDDGFKSIDNPFYF